LFRNGSTHNPEDSSVIESAAPQLPFPFTLEQASPVVMGGVEYLDGIPWQMSEPFKACHSHCRLRRHKSPVENQRQENTRIDVYDGIVAPSATLAIMTSIYNELP
jgi:hypothetical protein